MGAISVFGALGQLGSEYGRARTEKQSEDLERRKAEAYIQQLEDIRKNRGWENPFVFYVGQEPHVFNSVSGEIRPFPKGASLKPHMTWATPDAIHKFVQGIPSETERARDEQALNFYASTGDMARFNAVMEKVAERIVTPPSYTQHKDIDVPMPGGRTEKHRIVWDPKDPLKQVDTGPAPAGAESLLTKYEEAKRIAVEQGYRPGTKAYNEYVRSLLPGGASATKIVFGGAGEAAAPLSPAQQRLAEAYRRKYEANPAILPQIPNKPVAYRDYVIEHSETRIALTPGAQAIIETSTPTHQQIKELMAVFEPMKDDNTPFKFFRERALYGAGKSSPIGKAADAIAQLELNRVVGAARVMRGASRSVRTLEMAMRHLPNVWIDSPKLIYSKLSNLDHALGQIENDAYVYGRKGGVSTGYPGAPAETNPDPLKLY
jgi:hypothetical protein